jgi:DNA-binding transcriptional regulator YhcF (GntR family)
MKLEFESSKSIYLQISENIENDILNGVLAEGDQVPSTNQMAALYRINPATAAKGINMLVDEGIIHKRRGIGMFVSEGAGALIRGKRKKAFRTDYVVPLLEEAASLGISNAELTEMISGSGEEL